MSSQKEKRWKRFCGSRALLTGIAAPAATALAPLCVVSHRLCTNLYVPRGGLLSGLSTPIEVCYSPGASTNQPVTEEIQQW